MAIGGELYFYLIQPILTVFGFDINNAELVTEIFFLVVRVMPFYPDQELKHILIKKSIQEMNQQIPVFLCT